MTQLGPEAFSNPAKMDDLFKQARIADLQGTADIADNHIRDTRVRPAYISNHTHTRQRLSWLQQAHICSKNICIVIGMASSLCDGPVVGFSH